MSVRSMSICNCGLHCHIPDPDANLDCLSEPLAGFYWQPSTHAHVLYVLVSRALLARARARVSEVTAQ